MPYSLFIRTGDGHDRLTDRDNRPSDNPLDHGSPVQPVTGDGHENDRLNRHMLSDE